MKTKILLLAGVAVLGLASPAWAETEAAQYAARKLFLAHSDMTPHDVFVSLHSQGFSFDEAEAGAQRFADLQGDFYTHPVDPLLSTATIGGESLSSEPIPGAGESSVVDGLADAPPSTVLEDQAVIIGDTQGGELLGGSHYPILTGSKYGPIFASSSVSTRIYGQESGPREGDLVGMIAEKQAAEARLLGVVVSDIKDKSVARSRADTQ